MDSWDEALFELIYDQPIMKMNGKYPYKVNLQGKQQIEDVDIQVALYDEDGIADVAVIDDNDPLGINTSPQIPKLREFNFNIRLNFSNL